MRAETSGESGLAANEEREASRKATEMDAQSVQRAGEKNAQAPSSGRADNGAAVVRSVPGRTIAQFTVIVLTSACGNLAQTALNSMLGFIASDMSVGVETAQWLTTGYMLALGVTVPACTFLMRRLSRRVLVAGAIILFAAGSVVCMLAGCFGILLLGRIMEAISAGITLPLMQTTAMTSFPPGRQATAMGVAGIAMGFAPNIGPTIGGVLVDTAGWRSFFVLLLVLSTLLLAAAFVAFPRGRAEDSGASIDVPSLVLSCVGFGMLLLGLSNLSNEGLASPTVWAEIVVGAVVLVLFVRWQGRVPRPLVDMRIFSSRRYCDGFLAQCFLFASYMGVTLVIPLFVENLRGGSALEAGMLLLPGTAAAFVANPIAGVLTDKVGARPVVIGAGCFLAAGALLWVFADETTPTAVLMVFQGIRAMGVSGLIGPLASWSLGGLERRVVSHGSAFAIVARQACSSFGTAAMVLAVTMMGSGTALAGYRVAFALSAAFAVLVLVAGVMRVRD